MRDIIFILILLTMAGLAVWHTSTESWFSVSVDIVIAFYAFGTWNPARRFRR